MQSVEVMGTYSNWQNIAIPQSSVQGLQLFAVFLNDIDD